MSDKEGDVGTRLFSREKLEEIQRALDAVMREMNVAEKADAEGLEAERVTREKLDALRWKIVENLKGVRNCVAPIADKCESEIGALLEQMLRYASIGLQSHGRLAAKLARRQDEVRELHERIRKIEEERKADRDDIIRKLRDACMEHHRKVEAHGIAAMNAPSRREKLMSMLDQRIELDIVTALEDIADAVDPDGACPF